MKLVALFTVALVGCATTPARPKTNERASQRRPIAQARSGLVAGIVRAVAYSGYRRGHHPDRGQGAKEPTRAQLLEDLRLLVRAKFRLLRLYDAGALSARVLALIAEQRLDLRVMLGAWLQAEVSNHQGCPWLRQPIPASALAVNRRRNQAEVSRVIALARAYPKIVVAVNVGNEALVSWNDHMVTVDGMLAYLRRVKAAIRQPVSTADNYVPWVEHGQKLAAVVDFAAVHTYPAWEKKRIDEAMPFTIANLRAVRDSIGATPIVIAEAGWATVAEEFGARAGQRQQQRYFEALMAWSARMNITTFFFEAFDEPWKGNPRRPRGAEKHWGLFNVDRQPKLVLQRSLPKLAPAAESD